MHGVAIVRPVTALRHMQRLIAVICLCAFTLGQAWLSPAAVWCYDADTGLVHFEVACCDNADRCCSVESNVSTTDADHLYGDVGGSDECGCTHVTVVQAAIQTDRAEFSAVAPAAVATMIDPSTLIKPALQTCELCATSGWQVPRPVDPLGLIEFTILIL